MKLNIRKLQEGGDLGFSVFKNPGFHIAPQQHVSQSSPEKSGGESGDDSKLLSKEVLNELIKKGLPNEVEEFINDLRKSESSPMGLSSRHSVYNLLGKANKIIHNSDMIEKAIVESSKNEGLGELALTSTGGMYVRDEEGKLGIVSTSEFDREKHQALTVSDLNKARRYDSNLAFDQNVISSIQNSVGIPKISEQVFQIINHFGSDEYKNESYVSKSGIKGAGEGIIGEIKDKKPTDAQAAGLKKLRDTYQSMGMEGIYKITSEDTQSAQSGHVKEAMSYLLSVLPKNAVNVLKARAAESGVGYMNPMNIIQNALLISAKDKHTNGLEYQEGLNKSADGSGSGDKSYMMTSLEKLVNGDLDVSNDFVLANPTNNNYGLRLKGTIMGQLTDTKGELVSNMSLGKALDKGLGTAINKQGIYVGNKKLPDYEVNQLIYNGQPLINTMVPVNRDGSPNLTLFEGLDAANKEIEKYHITSASQKNAIYKKKGVPMVQVDEKGEYLPMTKQYLKPFIVTHVLSPNAVGSVNGNEWTHEIEDDQQDGYKSIVESVYADNKMAMPTTGFFGGSNKIVKTAVFMPLMNSAQNDISFNQGHGSVVKGNTLAQDMMRQRQNLQTQTSILNNQ